MFLFLFSGSYFIHRATNHGETYYQKKTLTQLKSLQRGFSLKHVFYMFRLSLSRRLNEASSSPYHMTDIWDQIPSTLEGLDEETTGYHQNCYKSFTGNLHRLQVSKASLSGEPPSSIKDSLRHLKSLSTQSEGARCSFLFPNQCIFCDKTATKFKGRLIGEIRYQLGTADQLQEAALTLHSHIIKAFKDSEELPWPPTAQELDAVKMDELLPEHLVQFLRAVVTGTQEVDKCEKTQRLVYSITQDVCRAATRGQWKLPKHILLCATLRHLYHSKQVSNKIIYCL